MRFPRLYSPAMLQAAQIAASELDGAAGVTVLAVGVGLRWGLWLSLIVVGVFLLLGSALRRRR